MFEQRQRLQEPLRAPDGGHSVGLIHARDTAAICELSGYALLSFEGVDAEAFLHAQLSSDVQGLTPHHCQLSTYNSPKGRVLATLLLWRSSDGFIAQLPAAIAETVRRRLAMFVLRSKVRIALASDRFIRIGICGPKADAVLAAGGLDAPREDYATARGRALEGAANPAQIDVLLRLPGNRCELLIADANAAVAAWNTLVARGATPAQESSWHWATVRSAIPEIAAETQDQFVAQMLNYELVGGVSFTKGCYPGQEIVARTQYRGAIKRRTFLAHVLSDHEPAPAEVIHNGGSSQAVGAVVNAAPSPEGGYDLLACLHADLIADGGNLRLGTVAGPAVELLPLPYSLPARA